MKAWLEFLFGDANNDDKMMVVTVFRFESFGKTV